MIEFDWSDDPAMWDRIETEDLVGFGAIDNLIREMNERLEYELRGAWRAGYDYLHVYEKNWFTDLDLGADPLEHGLTLTQYVYPSDSNEPHRLEGDGIVYRYTYDLTSVPDDVIRRAIRGDIDTEALTEAIDR